MKRAQKNWAERWNLYKCMKLVVWKILRLWKTKTFAEIETKLENTGAKVLSGRLAKVLSLLITSLTTCSCNAREHPVKSWRLGREQPRLITAELQGNYPNLKKYLKKIVISKVNERQSVIEKCHLGATRSHKLSSKVLSKELRNWKQKKFSDNAIFWWWFLFRKLN